MVWEVDSREETRTVEPEDIAEGVGKVALADRLGGEVAPVAGPARAEAAGRGATAALAATKVGPVGIEDWTTPWRNRPFSGQPTNRAARVTGDDDIDVQDHPEKLYPLPSESTS